MKRILHVLGSIGLLVLFGSVARADIQIDTLLTNGSFESPSVTTPGACPTGWLCDGSPGFGVYAPTSAQYNPSSDGLIPGRVVPDGLQVAYTPTGLAGSGSALQILSTTKWVAGNDYSFTFWLGVPKTEPDGTTPVVGAPPTLRLYFLMDRVPAGLPFYDLSPPGIGQWVQVTESVSAGQVQSAGAAGSPIGISFFVSTGATSYGLGNNQLINFDIAAPTQNSNVSPVPEVSFYAQFLVGLAGLAGAFALKRQARWPESIINARTEN